MSISHTAAFRAQADFPLEAKIKVGNNIWSPGVAGARLYEQVLSKSPPTIQKALDMAAALKESPFTAKATMGHLRWLYSGGQLEVDGTSYDVPVKAPKPAKVEAPKAEAKPEQQKPEPKFKAKVKAKVAASSKRSLVRTKWAA
jgi:hypothetical protein